MGNKLPFICKAKTHHIRGCVDFSPSRGKGTKQPGQAGDCMRNRFLCNLSFKDVHLKKLFLLCVAGNVIRYWIYLSCSHWGESWTEITICGPFSANVVGIVAA